MELEKLTYMVGVHPDIAVNKQDPTCLGKQNSFKLFYNVFLKFNQIWFYGTYVNVLWTTPKGHVS